jgi:hypothetical protein
VFACGRPQRYLDGTYIKKFSMKKMVYRLIARDRVFCEGDLAQCQGALTDIHNMICAGFSTDFQIEDFLIINCEVCDDTN